MASGQRYVLDVAALLQNVQARRRVKTALVQYMHPDVVRRCGVEHIVEES